MITFNNITKSVNQAYSKQVMKSYINVIDKMNIDAMKKE